VKGLIISVSLRLAASQGQHQGATEGANGGDKEDSQKLDSKTLFGHPDELFEGGRPIHAETAYPISPFA